MHSSLQPFCASLARGREQKAVMFGDSITFGSQVDPDFDHDIVYHRQWREELGKRYPEARLTVLNRGVPGNKITDAHARLQRDVLADSPDLVVIEFGINDCWDGLAAIDNYERELRRLLERLRSCSTAALVLLTANMMNHAVTPEARALAWFAERSACAQTSGWMDAYMDRMRRVARDLDLPLADGYANWLEARARGVETDAFLANRANHPNRDGHRLLSQALLELFK